jgi:hypothetical protein
MFRELGFYSVVCVVVGCSEPDCFPDEQKVGSVCRKVGDPSAEVDGREQDASEPPGQGDASDGASPDAGEIQAPDASSSAELMKADAEADAASTEVDAGSDAGSAAMPPVDSPACSTSKNACDGCAMLAHAPGSPCTAGIGECLASAAWECDGREAVVCAAVAKAPTPEICDGKDNDCDMAVDEDVQSTWYQDCDGDGYAASDVGSVQACTQPAPVGGCAWTAKRPVEASKSNWDCNDGSAAYNPAADFGVPPDGFTDPDLNCDGNATPGANILTMLTACIAELADIRLNTCSFIPPGKEVSTCIYYIDKAGVAVAVPDVCPDRVYVHTVVRDASTGSLTCSQASRFVQSWTCK